MPPSENPGHSQASLVQSLVESLRFSSICQQCWKTQQWPQVWKRSVFIPIPKKGNVKERSNYRTIALISHTSKECSKFSKLGFNSTWTKNFQMLKLEFEKAEEPDIKLPISVGSSKKQENSRKTSTSVSLTTLKPLTAWITTNCGNFLRRCEYQTTWPASWEICMQVRKQQLEPDLEQGTGSKSGKEYIKAVYCHSACLTYMQSTSCEMLAWAKHSWNQDCQEKYQ